VLSQYRALSTSLPNLPPKCVIGGGIICIDHKISGDGTLGIRLMSGLGRDIKEATLTVEGECEPKAVYLKISEAKTFTCSIAEGKRGEVYQHNMSLTYTDVDSGIEHTKLGNVYGKYE
jgi:hypothetical protein